MRFDIVTIFPEIFDSYFEQSLIKKAQEKGLIEIKVHDLRGFTEDPHRTVDGKPFGGGRGMVLKIEPIFKVVQFLEERKTEKQKNRETKKQKNKKIKTVLFSPRGEKFDQEKALEYSRLEQLIMICGRYEGVDERVAKYIADETISIGNYVLMGGEVAAMVVVEAVSRLIPGVVGKLELLKERIFKEKGFMTYPQYTRPEVFEPEPGVKWRVPKILLSGHHKKIEEWRKRHSKIIAGRH